MSRRLVVIAAVLSIGWAGCSGAKLRKRSDTVGEVIATARKNGAKRCAPVELAMAESHREFAVQELDEGDYYRARAEMKVAEANARAAVKKSPPHLCTAAVKPRQGDRDGDGLLDNEDRCPDDPEDKDDFEDADGCPDVDNDNDGILDVKDKCPLEPEDKDDFEDEDGCPDEDNDKDGLSDKVDACPLKAEDKDGFEDDDGCPDCDNDKDGVPECPEEIDKCPDKPAKKSPDGCPQKFKRIVVTKDKIELKQTVFFETAKSKIRRRSFALLNEVAVALKDRSKMEIRIEGHTDSRGSDRYNLKLSKGRAAAVRKYLIRRGVKDSRMVSEGYGESKPIADNRTAAGRAQNRRVEFVITKQ